jgi:hypothetical protein
MQIQLLVDDGTVIPMHSGDERIEDRIPAELLHKVPSRREAVRVLPARDEVVPEVS